VKLLKILIFTIGVLTLLAIFGTQFQLRDPNGPRMIDPSNPVHLPKVNVSKR
jgi:hypothetical protein